ncbi:hypothetical protein J132_04118 [Termitomyces sp. J132]|nr:hypothetical protein H2248_005266 [Termitomyces sp. 'cryptogamus']KNZ80859.1 hypothetical protein J132_04118 [Termitomyces sp. J132]
MNAPPVTKKQPEFDLLGDFDTNTSDPVAQTQDSRPPSYSQFDFRGSSLSANSLWSPSPLAASSGGDMGIWGDVKGNIKAGNDDIRSIVKEDEQQDSNTAPETDLSTVPPAETPTTETSASRQSGSSTLRKDQDSNSSSIQPEGMTSQQAEGTDPALNVTTVAESPNIQQDNADPAGKEAAAGQPSSTEENERDKKPKTGSENVEAVTLTAPVIDEEPFPEKNSDRVDKALELRNGISRIETDIIQIRSKLAWSSSTTSRVEILAQMEKEEEKLKSLKAKAERW